MSVAGLTRGAEARWPSADNRPGSLFHPARGRLRPPPPEVNGRERGRDPRHAPPPNTPRRGVTRGKRVRICSGSYQTPGKKLGLLSPAHDTLERQPPLPPLLPTPFCVSHTPTASTSHRRGWGSRRPDRTQLQLRVADGGGRAEGDEKGVRGPQPYGAAPGRPRPSRTSAEGLGAPPALGTRPGGPGRGAGTLEEIGTEESGKGGSPPRCPAATSEQGGPRPGGGRVGAGGAGGGRGVGGLGGGGAGPGQGAPLTFLPAPPPAPAASAEPPPEYM